MLNDSMSDAGALLYLTPVRSDDAYHGTLKADAAIRPFVPTQNPRAVPVSCVGCSSGYCTRAA